MAASTTQSNSSTRRRYSDAAVAPDEDERTSIAPSVRSVQSYNAISLDSDTTGVLTPIHAHGPSLSRSPSPPPSPGFFSKLGAIELENKGSVARDHLALERTFLAWLRTSLAFASIGIAITQLFRLNSAALSREPLPHEEEEGGTQLRNIGKPLGATFLGVAIMVLVIGMNRYYESQSWLLKGKFPASRGSVFLLTLVACALIVVSLVIILTVSPEQTEL